jgi:hypothetical protein
MEHISEKLDQQPIKLSVFLLKVTQEGKPSLLVDNTFIWKARFRSQWGEAATDLGENSHKPSMSMITT